MGTGGGGFVSGRFLPIFCLGRAFLARDLLEVVDVELAIGEMRFADFVDKVAVTARPVSFLFTLLCLGIILQYVLRLQ